MDWNEVRDYLENDEISGLVDTTIEDSLKSYKGYLDTKEAHLFRWASVACFGGNYGRSFLIRSNSSLLISPLA